MDLVTCLRCFHVWKPQSSRPKRCAGCLSTFWDEIRDLNESCLRCGHKWFSKNSPQTCPKCHRPKDSETVFKQHKKSNTVEHIAWKNMIQRCHNPDNPMWEWYGGRGIKVCDRWRKSFLDFLEDVGLKPSPELTLERINNDKGYEPGNVKWATRKEQADNRRKRPKIWIGPTVRAWGRPDGS